MISGLAKLVDLLMQLGKLATPWVIIGSFSRGVILRFGGGKLRSPRGQPYSRVIGPTDGPFGTGFHFMFPFIERTLGWNIVPTMATYSNQVFQSKDGTTFLTLVHLLWRVEDIVVFLLDVENAEDVIVDAAAGITRRLVSEMHDEELLGTVLESKLTIATRNRTKKFGVYVEAVYVSELAPTSLKGGIMKIDTGANHIE